MDRRFGVEIEIVPNLPRHALQKSVEKCGEPLAQSYGYVRCRSEREISQWYVKTDASVSRGRYNQASGWELVTPALKGDVGLDRLVKVLQEVNRHAAHMRDRSLPLVDQSTGLHVHVEIKDFTPPQLARLIWLFARFQDVLYGLVASHRSRSGFCQRIAVNLERARLESATSMDALQEMLRYPGGRTSAQGDRWSAVPNPFQERRFGLNLTNFVHYGTVEFRLKESTLNPVEVRDWVCLLLAIVERAKEELKVTDASKVWTLERLLKLIGWERKVYKLKFEGVQRRLTSWYASRVSRSHASNSRGEPVLADLIYPSI